MPNEILAKICTHAVDDSDGRSLLGRGKKWLTAVRLTCKQLYPSATAEFAGRFFVSLRVMVARGSLETLLEVCKHPVIGPRVSGIALYGCRLDRKLLSPLRRDLEFRLSRKDLSGIRQARSRLQLFMDFLEEEVEFENHKGIFQILVNALEVIQTHRHSVALGVFDLPNYSRSRILGRRVVVKQVSKDNEAALEDMFNRDFRSSLNTLLTAATKSGCHVRRLSLDAPNMWSEVAASQQEMYDTLPLCTKDIFLNMREFDLDVSADFFGDDLNGLLSTVLSLTKNLEDLCLDLGYCPAEWFQEYKVEPFGKATQSLQSDCLYRIEVVEAFVRQDDLIPLLGRHTDSLEELYLLGCVLVGSWKEVMIWIRDHCTLAWLRMDLLHEYDEDSGEPVRTKSSHYYGESSRLAEYLDQEHAEQTGLEGED
jgi:hypothetical protein